MATIKRPDEATYPVAQRPQVSNMGMRPRVTHLLYKARLNPGLEPTGLPDHAWKPGVVSKKDHSYRNAVFQALCNTPMFVNFLRDHNRQKNIRGGGECLGTTPCLACHMYSMAGFYWSGPLAVQLGIRDALAKLWMACKQTFWCRQAPNGHWVGPREADDEFYADSFLLHLLTAIQSQLEAHPGEYQTFLRMFTVHTARRWKCSRSGCDWTRGLSKWDQSLFLPIDVHKPVGKVRQTDLKQGILHGLERQASSLAMRLKTASKCTKCSSAAVAQMDVVNFPEVLILIRNTDALAKGDKPDIHYEELLEFKAVVESKVSPRANLPPPERQYQLVAGIVDRWTNKLQPRSMPFVRGGPEDLQHKWFAIVDEKVAEVGEGLKYLDGLQRSHDGNGDIQSEQDYPEIFIYARVDRNGIPSTATDYDVKHLVHLGSQSPDYKDTLQQKRDLVARSVTDIFIQNIGKGLLKFKVTLAPADPGPNESVPFTIDLGYELNNCYWRTDGKLIGRLLPDNEIEIDTLDGTPKELQPYHRYFNRKTGPGTPNVLTDAQHHLQAANGFRGRYPGDQVSKIPNQADIRFATTGQGAFENPFKDPSNNAEDPIDADGMALDPQPASTFLQNPHYTGYAEQQKKAEAKKFIEDYSRDNSYNPWGKPPKNGGNKNGVNKNKNKNNKWKNRNNNNKGRGGHHNGRNQGGNNRGRGGNRGRGRGRGK